MSIYGEEIPKRHKWTSRRNQYYLGGGYTKCTNCGMKYAWGAYHEVSEFSYCPTCGALMKKEATQ